MEIPQPPKGTRDFYPVQMAEREQIFASWKKSCIKYGFEEFDAPQFEHLSLFTQKSGPEIEKQLYSFMDKGERMIALRPEMTPSLARMVATQGANLPKPVRWFSIPRLFRYEKMQKGRLREFFQLNMDILGIEDVSADAELIAAAIDMMRDLGCDESDFTVHISSRKLLEELFLAHGAPAEKLMDIYGVLDKKHKLPAEVFSAELASVIGDPVLCDAIAKILAATSLDELSTMGPDLKSVTDLNRLFVLLKTYGVQEYAVFDIGVIRGLAYYTGIVFEIFDKKRAMRAIAGGGRYDNLVKQYGGPDTPAVGFAAGDVVLADLLREKGVLKPQPPRSLVYIACLEDHYPEGAISLVQQLRNNDISAEFSLKPLALGKQFKLANAARALYVVVTGGDEETRGCVSIKDMTSGESVEIKKEDLLKWLKEHI